MMGQGDGEVSELGLGGTVGVEQVAVEGKGDELTSFSDAVGTADGTYDGAGFDELGPSLSGRMGVALV